MAALRTARILHVDETSFSLNGKLVWVWVFFDPETGNTAFVLRDSRGRDVLNEVLGDWDGRIICDGWKSYRSYRLQRCWAHLINEARGLVRKNPECPEAEHVYRALQDLRVWQSSLWHGTAAAAEAARLFAQADPQAHLQALQAPGA